MSPSFSSFSEPEATEGFDNDSIDPLNCSILTKGLICLVRKPGVATFRGVVILSGVETLFLLRFDGVPTFFDETVLSFDVFNFFFDCSRESLR